MIKNLCVFWMLVITAHIGALMCLIPPLKDSGLVILSLGMAALAIHKIATEGWHSLLEHE